MPNINLATGFTIIIGFPGVGKTTLRPAPADRPIWPSSRSDYLQQPGGAWPEETAQARLQVVNCGKVDADARVNSANFCVTRLDGSVKKNRLIQYVNVKNAAALCLMVCESKAACFPKQDCLS